MNQINVKKRDGKDLDHELRKLPDYTVSNGGKHSKIQPINGGASVHYPPREMGTGLWCEVVKQLAKIDIKVISVLIIGVLVIYFNT